MSDPIPSELDQRRRENARLTGLLEAHGIAWRSSGPSPTEAAPISEAAPAKSPLATREKVALFRRIFRGRDDEVALRWQSNSSGRSSATIEIKLNLDYPQASATLRSRSVAGLQQQTALAMRSVIVAIEKRRLKRKQ